MTGKKAKQTKKKTKERYVLVSKQDLHQLVEYIVILVELQHKCEDVEGQN